MIINRLPIIQNRPFSITSKATSFSGVQSSDIFVRNSSMLESETNLMNDDFNSFCNWAKETNFLSHIKNLIQNEAKVIGSGFEGTTYEIPNTDKWVVKEYKRSSFLPIPKTAPEIVKINDISPELNIGQTIARVEIPAGKKHSYIYYILKKQNGDSIGIGYQGNNDINKLNTTIHLKSLEEVANMPDESFDKLITDISYITEIGYQIDCGNPNNLMFDKEKKQINFVDINDKYNHSGNQYGDVLFALLGCFFALKFENSRAVSQEEKSIADSFSKKIISKYFNAMKRANIKFNGGSYFYMLLETNKFDSLLNSSNLEDRILKLHKMGLY